jgi:hypothetical protein
MRRPRVQDEDVMERGSVTPSIEEVVMRFREQWWILDSVAGEMFQTFASSGVCEGEDEAEAEEGDVAMEVVEVSTGV